MKKTLFYIIALSALIISFLFLKNYFSCKRISCIKAAGLDKFKLSDIFQENNRVFRASYKDKDSLMKVETIYGMDPEEGDQYVNSGIAKIKGIYTDALVPYPGIASQQTGCNPKLQPTFKKVTTNTDISYFVGYLNSNLTFGTCVESQITHRGIIAFYYCSKSKQGHQIEITMPKKGFEVNQKYYIGLVESLSCL